jgi:HSP20 family molecular chaperone IbpA
MKTQTVIKPGEHALVRTFCGSFSDMDHLYEELHAETRPFNRPAINIIETDKKYMLQLALPGYHKESLRLEIRDDMLVIEAVSSTVPDYYKDIRRFYKREFAPEPFTRTFLLPEDVDAATADFSDGILTVYLTRGIIKVVIADCRDNRQMIRIQ